MLVEINLLPKKEPKSITLLVFILSAFFIILVAGLLIFWQGTRLNGEISRLKNEITTTQKLVETEQAKQGKNNVASDSFAQLESAVNWANDEPLKSAPIIKRLVALLPARGFVQTISYAESGTMTMAIQFDSSREAAYFYKTLLDQSWIESATLSSLATSNSEQSDSEGTTENINADEQFVPRYLGQFEVILNRDNINNEELAEKNESKQGGTES